MRTSVPGIVAECAIVLAAAALAVVGAAAGMAGAALVPALPAAPAAPGGAAINGLVRSATTGAPVSDTPVQLVFIGAQGAEAIGQTRSGAGGRFTFTGLLDGRYLVTARHQGVSYAAHALVAGAPVEVTVQVYEVSTRVPLRIAALGIAVDALPGYVRVNEVIHLQNPTTRSFMGEIRLPLPRGARYVVFTDGFHQPRADGAVITDRLIVRPGSHQVAYAYSVGGGGEVSLDRELALPVDRVEMFVAAPAEARSPRLQALPIVTSEGRVYTRASGRAAPPGELKLAIAGVPSSRLWLPPVASGTLAALLVVGLMVAIARTAP